MLFVVKRSAELGETEGKKKTINREWKNMTEEDLDKLKEEVEKNH